MMKANNMNNIADAIGRWATAVPIATNAGKPAMEMIWKARKITTALGERKPACINCFCSFFTSEAEGGRSLLSGEASLSASSVVGLWSSVSEKDACAPAVEPLLSFFSRSVAALCGLTTSQYRPIPTSEMQTNVDKAIIKSMCFVLCTLFLVYGLWSLDVFVREL